MAKNRVTGTKQPVRLSSAFRSFDMFGKSVGFRIEGKETHGSYIGAILTILVIFVTLSYSFRRIEILTSYGDTSHQVSQAANDYSKDSPLDFADTSLVFNFAIKIAGKYDTHYVDTHGYIQYVVKNLGIEFTD